MGKRLTCFVLQISCFGLLTNILLVSCNTVPEPTKIVTLPDGNEIEFIYIPPGSFKMGSNENEIDRHGDEGPVRNVHLTRGFYMGKYEVTQGQWMSVMGNNPSVFKNYPDSEKYPVDMISWNKSQEFINRINELDLGTFRLPTEAEWEYACRAGTNTRYYWGTDSTDWKVYDYAWAFSRAEGKSHEVGTKKANRWGLHDMSGNVWEWCQDWRGAYQENDTIDPGGAASGTKKIYRGGSWFNRPSTLRSANRNGHEPDVTGTNSGMRLVLEIND